MPLLAPVMTKVRPVCSASDAEPKNPSQNQNQDQDHDSGACAMWKEFRDFVAGPAVRPNESGCAGDERHPGEGRGAGRLD